MRRPAHLSINGHVTAAPSANASIIRPVDNVAWKWPRPLGGCGDDQRRHSSAGCGGLDGSPMAHVPAMQHITADIPLSSDF